MPKILLYERPITSSFFREVIRGVHGSAEVVGISSYRGSSDIWSGEYLYRREFDGSNVICDSLMDDIICRDRSLSLMDKDRAERIVRRFWNGAQILFERGCFDYFYTVSVDCYEIDILLRLAYLYDVCAVSWIGTFLDGYARVTLRGERCPLGRKVSSEEAETVTGMLLNKFYLPSSETTNVTKGKKEALLFYARRKLIEVVCNPLQRLVKRDPDNLMYNVCNLKGLGFGDLYRSDYDDLFSSIEHLEIDRQSTVYYPMHLIPEATTSYWCHGVITPGHGGNNEAYAHFIKRFVSQSDSSVHFLIKEHPAMFGRRCLSFYRELQAMDNVELIHPMVRSNELLERVDNVLVDDGTVGIEALLRGKRVISLEKNYYSELHPNISVESRVSKSSLMRALEDPKPTKMVTSLLADMFPSDYSNGKAQGSCSAESVAAGIRLYFESLDAFK